MPNKRRKRTAPPGPDIKLFVSKRSYHNLPAAELYEQAIVRSEGHVAKNGPLVVLTGQHTGRSAFDKFIVRDAASELAGIGSLIHAVFKTVTQWEVS
jgi:hypothetical protein